MDGHFVPAVTIGPAVLADLRRYTSLPLECHLMADNVEGLAADLAEAGADSCVFHVEAVTQSARTVKMIRSMGMSVGVALRPNTPLSILEPLIDTVDTVLLTGVNISRSGERSDPVRRVEQARAFIDTTSKSVELHVEGRMDQLTTRHVVAAGANVLVLTQSPPRGMRSRE